MSIEVGPVGSYVYISEDGSNGQSEEALRQTLTDVTGSEDRFPKAEAALREVIESGGNRRHLLDRFKAQGRFLIGIKEYHGFGKVDQPLDGLLYAEVEGLMDSGAFSVVRMGTWVTQARANKQPYEERSLREQLIDMGLSEVRPDDSNDLIWGVPVSRATRIIDFGVPPDLLPDGYIYGHAKDREAVRNLDVPEPLKYLIATLVDTWHEAEQAGELDAKVTQIRATLQE